VGSRTPWQGDEESMKRISKNGSVNEEGYVNVASGWAYRAARLLELSPAMGDAELQVLLRAQGSMLAP
jgi:hypothetical protein